MYKKNLQYIRCTPIPSFPTQLVDVTLPPTNLLTNFYLPPLGPKAAVHSDQWLLYNKMRQNRLWLFVPPVSHKHLPVTDVSRWPRSSVSHSS